MAPKGSGRAATGRFEQGHKFSTGREPGSLNKATLMAKELLKESVSPLMEKMLEKAKEGDITALKFCIERLVPPVRDHQTPYNIGEITNIAQEAEKVLELTNALMRGDISESQAMAAAHLLAHARKSFELKDIAERLDKICDHVGLK